MAVSVLVNNDNDWPLLGSKYQYFWEKSRLLTVYLAQNVRSREMMFSNILSYKTVSNRDFSQKILIF